MTTIRAYTTIEQSRKLAEILPLESADMHYWKRTWRENDYAISVGHSKELQEGFESKCIEYIPCWSLASLLGVLPYCPDLSKHTDGKWYITTYPNDVHTCLMAYDNPIDACYEMIIRLHELKIMKELSIEEKAKAYDEALKQIKECTPDENGFITIYPQEIFPELEESKDERICKALIDYFKWNPNGQLLNECSNREVFAWLEKQGEQNPAWSEGDETMLKRVIDFIPQCMTAHGYNEYINWLKSLKDRVQPNPAWGEEDRRMLIGLIDELDAIMNKATPNEISVYSKYTNWLKSLRPQSTWKPSGEQIYALRSVVTELKHSDNKYQETIEDLYNDLEKLREE